MISKNINEVQPENKLLISIILFVIHIFQIFLLNYNIFSIATQKILEKLGLEKLFENNMPFGLFEKEEYYRNIKVERDFCLIKGIGLNF